VRPLAVALAVVALTCGCTSRRTIGQPNLSVVDAVIGVHRNVDILVMLDNSPGTSPKIQEVRNRFPQLLQRIQGLAAQGKTGSFHIGVVDSDLGAGPFTLNQGQCHPDGDGGILRTAPSPSSAGVQSNCSGWQLDNGAHYIDYDSATNVSNTGALSVGDAFQCISAVGTAGCGFEMPLEAVYRVLASPTTNPGFLRDDAILVVILMTDEDDCSAPPDSQLFDPSAAGVAMWGTLQSFRCTQWGIVCDGKPLTGGPLSATSCTPATGGPLFDVTRYQSLFTSIKSSSDDVVLATIVAPSTPFSVTETMPCADQVNTPSCPVLEHSCIANSVFFADPAVRINTVTAAVPHAITGSVCDTDYSGTFTAVADALTQRMSAGCLPGAVVDLADPGCIITVGDVEIPRCDTQGRLPCWDLVDDTSCTVRLTPAGNSQQLRLRVEGAPPAAAITAHCPLYEP
jgi:hypothetical protein